MATYSVNVTESYSFFPDNLSGSEATVFAVTNSLSNVSYFSLESITYSSGFYSGSIPSISGSFSYSSGINNLVNDNYKMSAVVAPGGGSITFTPAVPVTGSQLYVRGTGYKDVINQANAVVSSFAATVNNAGGLLTGSEYSALLSLTSDLISYNLLGKMKAIYPVVSSQKNFLPNTDTLTSWRYVEYGGTITGGQLDPLGGYTAFYLTGSANFLPSPNSVSPVNVPLVQSVWVKSATGGNVSFSIGSGADNGTRVSKVATPTWTRITNTFTSGLSGGMFFEFISGPIYVWHPQVELGTTPTDYQATVGLAADIFKNSFKFNLINPSQFTGSFTSGWTFGPTGMTPNGTSAYMNTNMNASASLQRTSVHLSFYSRTQNTSLNAIDMGCYQPTVGEIVLTHYYNSNTEKIFNAYLYPSEAARSATSNTLGLAIGTRTSLASAKLYFADSLLNTNTSTISNNVPSASIAIGASFRSDTLSAQQLSNRECAFASIGDGLSDTDAFYLYQAVQRYQTLLNRQV